MENINSFIIPTSYRSKISHELSHPVGAEKISIALASTTQLHELVVHFSSDYRNLVRSGNYTILSVRYFGATKRLGLLSSSGIPLINKWQINVSPVPRILRHKTHQYILDVALPTMKQWLDQRTHLAHEGSEILTFFFDGDKEEFSSKQESNLEPMRN